jgi:heme oxygenase
MNIDDADIIRRLIQDVETLHKRVEMLELICLINTQGKNYIEHLNQQRDNVVDAESTMRASTLLSVAPGQTTNVADAGVDTPLVRTQNGVSGDWLMRKASEHSASIDTKNVQ